MAEKDVKGGLSEKTGKKELVHRIFCFLRYGVWAITMPTLVVAILMAILIAVAFLLVTFLSIFSVSILSRRDMIFLISIMSMFLVLGIVIFIDRKWHLWDKINKINDRLSLACFHKIDANINKDSCYLYEADSKTVYGILIFLGICVVFILLMPFIIQIWDDFACGKSLVLNDIINKGIKKLPASLILTVVPITIGIFVYFSVRIKMLGIAWELSREGIKIIKNKKESEFIPWEFVRKYDYDHIADLRSNKKYYIIVSLKKYLDLKIKFNSFAGNKNGGKY